MSLPKKVLQVSPAYYPAISIGGPIFTNLTFSKALQDLGYEVEVLTTEQGLNAQKIKELKASRFDESAFSYRIHRFPYFGYSHFTFAPGHIFWLAKNLKRFDLVILQAVWNFPIWISYLMCLYYRKPYIIIPHGSLYPETVGLKSTTKKQLFLWLYVKNMLKRARYVLFSTLDEKEKVEQFLAVKLSAEIVPNMVDQKPFLNAPAKGTFRKQFNIEPETKLLSHYGRVNPKKGIPYVLNLLPQLIEKFPSLLYVIAGGCEDPAYENELKQLVAKHHLEKQVLFTGLLSQELGISLLRDSDVFVLPSLSENFGMSVVEAMLCETAVVVSDQVGIAQELKEADAGLVIQLENDSLKHAIESLLENTELNQSLGRKGAEFVKTHYTEEVVKNKLAKVLLG